MQTVVVRHKVGDVKTWLAGHQDRLDVFAPAISGYRVFQDMDDPNSVVLVIDATDLELLGAIINDPNNAGLKAKHTVIEPVILSMEVNS